MQNDKKMCKIFKCRVTRKIKCVKIGKLNDKKMCKMLMQIDKKMYRIFKCRVRRKYVSKMSMQRGM